MKPFEPIPQLLRRNRWCVAALLTAVCAPVAQSADAPWRMDRVTLRSGRVVEGLIEQQTEQTLQMLEIRRKANALYGVYQPVERSDVAAIAALSEADRRATRQRFDEYRNRVRIEAARMESVAVVRQGDRLRYEGEHFVLESSAPEEVVRRSIVRIEQLFAAMRQMIPAHGTSSRAIEIRLFGSSQEYHAFVQQQWGLPIANPAVFHRPTNTIAAGEDLLRLAEQLQQIQLQHDEQRAVLEKERAEMPKTLEMQRQALDKSPTTEAAKRAAAARLRKKLQDSLAVRQRQLDTYQRRNDAAFAQATSRMFAMLYHEALHAYLENFVYPGNEYEVPRWLHEGLAQVFESSTLDGQTFYVEAPHEASLKRLQMSLPSVSLRQLLTADGNSFLVVHGQNPQASQLNYATAWGLVHYLTFECHLVGSLAMDQFVRSDRALDSPIGRFEKLVQMPLPAFEAQWREYIQSLKPGASPAPKPDR